MNIRTLALLAVAASILLLAAGNETVIVDGQKVTLGGKVKAMPPVAFNVQLIGFRHVLPADGFEDNRTVAYGTLETPLAFKGMKVRVILRFYRRFGSNVGDYQVSMHAVYETTVQPAPAGKPLPWMMLLNENVGVPSSPKPYYQVLAEPVVETLKH